MPHSSVRNAYLKFERRQYNYLYLALDIHGTCADSDYHNVSRSLYPVAAEALRKISALPEVKIILYSCCHPSDYLKYKELFDLNGIRTCYFNENPEIENTPTGCFTSKFYYDLIFEDKGVPAFDPSMWPNVADAFYLYRQFNKRILELYPPDQFPVPYR